MPVQRVYRALCTSCCGGFHWEDCKEMPKLQLMCHSRLARACGGNSGGIGFSAIPEFPYATTPM